MIVYDTETESHNFDCGFPLLVLDTDSSVSTMNTNDINKNLYNLKDLFDFSNINKNYQLFSKENEKVVGLFRTETPKNLLTDEFI